MSLLTASLLLPKEYNYFSGKTLTIEDVSAIDCYRMNVRGCDSRVCFDSGNFIGIRFMTDHDNKYSVWALDKELKSGPEYRLDENPELREIVINYLEEHKELGLSIDDFL